MYTIWLKTPVVLIFDIKYDEIHIMQYRTVPYLGCLLDQTLSAEAMALNVINKINSRLRFRYRKNRF